MPFIDGTNDITNDCTKHASYLLQLRPLPVALDAISIHEIEKQQVA